MEARRIADALRVSLDASIDRYVDEPPCDPDTLILIQRDGACVFLEHTEGSKVTRCLIHPIRPAACREWMPGLSQRACQEGLTKYWGLKVNPSGQLEGSDQEARDFQAFLKSLIG